MPAINIYNIVTNDRLELPVAYGIEGRQAVAEYLDISTTTLNRYMTDGRWKGRYKAVAVGKHERQDPYLYYKQWSMKNDRTEYFRKRWREKVENIH